MFYAHYVLDKKGPLSKIWLAAHWDKKLTRAHVFETNIESSIEGILKPKSKMALRTSGHLLVGIVRIYSRKAKYLLADCNEAFIKIKMAFRPGVVDLPDGKGEAAIASITLPEVFHDFDTEMAPLTIDMDTQVALNQSRAEDITLKEDYGTLSLMTDDAFDGMGFDEPEGTQDEDMVAEFEDDMHISHYKDEQSSSKSKDLNAPVKDDGFGGTVGEGLLDGKTGSIFEPSGLFDDDPLGNQTVENLLKNSEKTISDAAATETDEYEMGPASMGVPSTPSSPEISLANISNTQNLEENLPCSDMTSEHPTDQECRELTSQQIPLSVPPFMTFNDSTLKPDDEGFCLAPFGDSATLGSECSFKGRRKRKLIVDEVKSISGEEMKNQLCDTSEIVSGLDLAPPTKRLMRWKDIGGVEKLFSFPGISVLSDSLLKVYQRHLKTNYDDECTADENNDLDIVSMQRKNDENNDLKKTEDAESNLPHDLSHIFPSLHLEASRPSYSNDMSLSHQSIEMSNYLQPTEQQMFHSGSHQQLPEHSQQQILLNIMTSNMPNQQHASQMTHQMIHNDTNQLSQPQQMMHSLVDQGPPLHTITPSIQNVHLPVVSETYNQNAHHSVMEPIAHHLLADGIPNIPDHLNQPLLNRHLSSHPLLYDQINHHLHSTHIQNTVNRIHNAENSFHSSRQPLQSQRRNELILTHANDIARTNLGEHYCHSQGSAQQNSSQNQDLMTRCHNDRYNAAQPQVLIPVNPMPSQNLSLSHQIITDVAYTNEPNSMQHSMVQNSTNLQNLDIMTERNQNCDSLIANSIQPTHNSQVEDNEMDRNNKMQNDKNELNSSNKDFAAPSSVEPALMDEQMDDETYEQYEERILTKRTVHMLHSIKEELEDQKVVSFSKLVNNNKRKQVAQRFYTLLVLKKQQAVELQQDATDGDMIIMKGLKFDTVYDGK